jgi:indole-3-glycerol phosphate synthase
MNRPENTLAQICADKERHVAARRAAVPLADLESLAAAAPRPRGFIDALRARSNWPALIAEIKKASPSGGLIRPDLNPASLARTYEDAGATCLSILTDTLYFQGKDDDLKTARESCALPCLRKDFMIEPYQIVESRALGADCVLLIMAALTDGHARDLYALARQVGMDVLVEVHDDDELDRASLLNPAMIGINSRNLKTMQVDLETAVRLAAKIPAETFKIAESGIKTHADITRLQAAGFNGFLVGESLMRQPDLARATRNLLGRA